MKFFSCEPHKFEEAIKMKARAVDGKINDREKQGLRVDRSAKKKGGDRTQLDLQDKVQ